MSRIVAGPWPTHPTSTTRVRCPPASRAASGAWRRSRSCVLLVASMVFLAWVSGRGEVTVEPVDGPTAVADRADRPPARGRRRGRRADHDGCRRRLGRDARAGGRHLSLPGLVARRVAGSPPSRRPRRGNAVHVFAVPKPGIGGSSSAVPTAIDPTSVYEAAMGRPFYVYWAPDSTHARVPDDRTRRHRAAARIGRRHAAGAHRARGDRRCTGPGRTSDRLLVHSGGDGPGAFLGEVARDGSTAADLGVDAGRLPGAGASARRPVPRLHRARHDDAGARGRRGQRRVRPSRGAGARRGAASASGPTATSWPSSRRPRPGPPVTVPVGPLRLVDAGSGAVRTLQPGNGRRLLLVARRPDDRRAPDRRTGRHGRRLARSTRPAAAAPGLALDLVFVDAASGLGPVADAVQAGRYVRRPGPPLLRPVRAEPPALGAGLERDRRSRSSPTTGRPGWSIIRPDGSGVRRIAAGDIGFWSP